MNVQEQEIVGLDEICRACLIKTDDMKHLLIPDEETVQLITKLSSISNLEIEVSESFPCFLCQNCEEKLKISYDFQQLVQKSHQFILACVSATDTLKTNIFKPLKLIGNIEQIEVISEPHIENGSDGFVNFINSASVQTEVQTTYESSVTKILEKGNEKDERGSQRNYFFEVDNIKDEDISKLDNANCGEVINATEDFVKPCEYVFEVNNIKDEDISKPNNANCGEVINTTEDFLKPCEVEKKTKNKQTMRLAQYSVEEVDKLIKKARERFFKHVNCLYCGFTAKDSRSLSVHMTRLHKKMRERWCLWCNKSFDDINEHIKLDHKDDFKCPLCEKYSTSTGHFLEHLASHSIERKHICKLCEKCFISARHLKMHYRVHTNDKPYSCRICSKGFVLIKSLNIHYKTHKKHRCKICEEYFETIKEYDEHKCFNKSTNEGSSQGTCETNGLQLEDEVPALPQNFCNMCKKKVRSLQSHIEKFHSDRGMEKKGEAGVLCTYCGKQFKSVAKLTVHVRTHTGEAPYKCSYCDKRMTTRVHLVVHERTHTGEKPHICKVCGKGFAQSSVLNTHMRLHTGRPEECKICFKRFCRPSELRQHMRKHTGEKPFLCSFCGQGFKQRSHLVEHNKTHSNERPYTCEYCKKCFKQASTLKSHINIHLGNKPYKCSQCSYACRQSYCLTQHMSQHENDQPKPDRPHRCGVCDRNFTTLAMLSSHYNGTHGSLDPVTVIKDSFKEIAGMKNEDGVLENFQQYVQ